MKFKVGDRVRVTEAVKDHRRKEVGKISTITNVNGNGLSYYSRKGVNYYSMEESIFIFYEDELELVFTKADLTDGMVVEYRDGDRRMVLGDVFTGFNGFAEVKNYDENLVNRLLTSCDINRIYISSSHTLDEYFNDKNLTLIWERPKEEPAKKMTVAEIEKELGYKVEIVSED